MLKQYKFELDVKTAINSEDRMLLLTEWLEKKTEKHFNFFKGSQTLNT